MESFGAAVIVYLIMGTMFFPLAVYQNLHFGKVGAVLVGIVVIYMWGVIFALCAAMFVCPPFRRFLGRNGVTMNGKYADA